MNISESIDNCQFLQKYSVNLHASIREAMIKFGAAHSHILPVVTADHKVVSTLSLFSILSFLQDHCELDQEIGPWLTNHIVFIKSDGELESVAVESDSLVGMSCETGDEKFLSSDNFIRYQNIWLRRKYVMMKQITECIYCGIIVVNEQGQIVVYNAAAQRIMALPQKSVIHRNIGDVEALENLQQVISENRGQGRHQIQMNGCDIIVNLNPLMKGKVRIGVLVVFHEAAKAECISQELFVTEKLLKEINVFLESSHDGIFITDSQGKVIRVNAAWERIFSISRQKVVGLTVSELVERGIYSKSAALEALTTGKTSTVMFKNGDRNIMSTGTPVFNSLGEITSSVVNVRDITELNYLRYELEKQQQLAEKYSKEVKELRRQQQNFPEIVTHSKAMQQVMDMVSRVADVDATVLVTGESGVGKEVVTRFIHKLSTRADGPMIKINCGAIPGTLLESELFGYEPGAFTGALARGKTGLFELANGGTLLLDEIGEIGLDLQVKLLRALQEREIMKIGGVKPIKIDVRIIAVTNRDLKKMIREGKFREDLYYRLNVINIHIPPLRERVADIAPLIFHFLNKYNHKYNKSKEFTPLVINMLQEYGWPGNIRELENLVENLVILVKGDEIVLGDLPDTYQQPAVSEKQIIVNGVMPLKTAVEIVEAQLLQNAKERFISTRKIASALGINQSTVVRKMHALKHQ